MNNSIVRDECQAMAKFAHEGLPYMTQEESWFKFNDGWMVNVWWNWEETTYRATAYRRIAGEIDIHYGIDLF